MASPTRFPNGITNVSPTSAYASLPFPSPIAYQTYFNDFHTYAAGDWLVTVVDTDTGGAAARTIDATTGGVLNILNEDNAADSTQLALGGTGAEPFKLTIGKKFWVGAKFSSSDVDKNFLAIGLASTDTDLQGGLPQDVVLFRVDTADANIDFVIGKGASASTTTAVGTVADYAEGTNNLTEVLAYYDGVKYVHVYVDGVLKKSVDVATTDYIPDTDLTLVMEIHNSDAAADFMAVDWVLVAIER
ncbi:hypothetical protein [Hyphomonas sp. CY54-11-8]|uniref:hypothetical protein n=1 Tax=Hyphomonas sp. CY54-11-8 TaxID=1280944 RepID=UPI0004591486|nr:hypothetical protein [Hyphomonas sp. CY54-11-8]KCZ47766.1 hypothetical protein HY17_04625 [Hyphomonas sp. CY54-11-8]